MDMNTILATTTLGILIIAIATYVYQKRRDGSKDMVEKIDKIYLCISKTNDNLTETNKSVTEVEKSIVQLETKVEQIEKEITKLREKLK